MKDDEVTGGDVDKSSIGGKGYCVSREANCLASYTCFCRAVEKLTGLHHFYFDFEKDGRCF